MTPDKAADGAGSREPQFSGVIIEGRGGGKLFGRRWRAPGSGRGKDPAGQVLILHGLGDHTGRHQHVAAALARAGLDGVMFDLRGHGRSEGRRGDVPDFDYFFDDIRAMADSLDPGLPRGILAFSFGGMLAAGHLLREPSAPWRCLALVAPWFRLRIKAPRWRVLLARAVCRFAPGLRQRTPLRREQLSSDGALLEKLDADRLTHRLISARLFFGAVACGEDCLARAPEITIPAAVWHGLDDGVTCPEASSDFAGRLGSTEKSFHPLPGLRHEPHNDIGGGALLDEISRWIAKALACSPADERQARRGAAPAQTS